MWSIVRWRLTCQDSILMRWQRSPTWDWREARFTNGSAMNAAMDLCGAGGFRRTVCSFISHVAPSSAKQATPD
jgi:hypothetical protein